MSRADRDYIVLMGPGHYSGPIAVTMARPRVLVIPPEGVKLPVTLTVGEPERSPLPTVGEVLQCAMRAAEKT